MISLRRLLKVIVMPPGSPSGRKTTRRLRTSEISEAIFAERRESCHEVYIGGNGKED
jgi:hypothetical protein